jgi:signal transduction histidine kinase/ActR/RegA family two-component response regulator
LEAGGTVRLRWGIRLKLVVSIASLSLVAAAAFAVGTPRRVERQAMHAMSARGRSIVQMTAYSVREALSRGDIPAVGAMLQGTRRDPDLAYVIVTDSTGRPVANVRGVSAASDPRLFNPSAVIANGTSDDWMGFSSPVTLGSQRIGSVFLGISLADVRQQITEARQASAGLGLLLFLGGAGLAFGIGTLITRPLDRLASTAGYIAAGDLEQRAEVTSDDEVAQLVRAFNMMVDSLQRTRDELANSNATLEERVEQRTAQVQEALRQLEIAKNEAEAANRMKSEFLATMSHEVRTPMNGVLGTLALVLESRLEDEQRRLLHLAKSSADALLVIINDILDLSKIEAGRMEIAPAPFRFRLACEDMFALLVVRATEKKLVLKVDIGDEVPEWLMGDAGRVRQVLFNLTGNAIKFTERGSVTLTVSALEVGATEATLHVEVRDTGIGIDEETQARLFKKFVQADASMARRYGGTGLGLAISKNLIELMGGTLGLRSAPGRGSTFFFDLRLGLAGAPPETAEVDTVGAPGAGVARATGAERAAFGSRRVLVVDDNPVNLTVAAAMLKKFGHTVDLARDGGEAVAKARARPYDAIFMDLQMPVMDGVAATAAIRGREGPNVATPIIALTANAMESDRVRSIAAGMNDHLTKPISPESLRAAVERWCPAPIPVE